MNSRMAVLTIAVCLLMMGLAAQARSANWLVYGTVRWSTGSPATSVQIRLMQGQREKAVVYTNLQGRWGISGAAGRPSDYTLQLWMRNRLLKTVNPQDMKHIPRGGRLNIRLNR